jgi:hypothetical protein
VQSAVLSRKNSHGPASHDAVGGTNRYRNSTVAGIVKERLKVPQENIIDGLS